MSVQVSIADPRPLTYIHRTLADRLSRMVGQDERARNLEMYASSDANWLDDLSGRAAEIGYETALRDLMVDLASVGLPLAGYVVDFAAQKGIELELLT